MEGGDVEQANRTSFVSSLSPILSSNTFTSSHTPYRPASVRWHGLEKISGYSSHLHKFEAPRTVAIACFYISAFLFFEMAWEYCSAMLYPEFQGMCCFMLC